MFTTTTTSNCIILHQIGGGNKCDFKKGYFDANHLLNEPRLRATGVTSNEMKTKVEELNKFMSKTLLSPAWALGCIIIFICLTMINMLDRTQVESVALQFLPFIFFAASLVSIGVSQRMRAAKVRDFVGTELFQDWKERNILSSASYYPGSRNVRGRLQLTLSSSTFSSVAGNIQPTIIIGGNGVIQMQQQNMMQQQQPLAPMIYSSPGQVVQPQVVQPQVVQPQVVQPFATHPQEVPYQPNQPNHGGVVTPVPVAIARATNY